MKNSKNIIIIFIGLIVIFFGYLFFGLKNSNPSKEISLNMISPHGNLLGKIVAASCGSTLHGSSDEYAACNTSCPDGSAITGQSQCGGACSADCGTCNNGAGNPPSCSSCSAGSNMVNGQCICNNGASNAPSCNTCAAGATLYNNLCVCANGATNMPSCNICPSGSTMQNGSCVCSNDAMPQSNCTQCPAGKAMSGGKCLDACELTNVCGQKVEGVMVNGVCSTTDNSDSNSSCITEFHFNVDSVNPNGSVEFSWSVVQPEPTPETKIVSRCSFVDLTNPSYPRKIPGLQDLDPTVNSARISNIQNTTRFCLVCQFVNLISNTNLGNTAVHQWIRVIKVGEN